MAGLPAEQRAVLHLKLWEALTFEEIASTLALPAVASVVSKGASVQTGIDQARIALAYRLAHGDLPASLDPLVPQFLLGMPSHLLFDLFYNPRN